MRYDVETLATTRQDKGMNTMDDPTFDTLANEQKHRLLDYADVLDKINDGLLVSDKYWHGTDANRLYFNGYADACVRAANRIRQLLA